MKKRFIAVLLAMILLIGTAYTLYEYLRPSAIAEQYVADAKNQKIADEKFEGGTAENKIVAPDVTVYDENGKEVRLSDFSGKPVVLNFWASWCGPCKNEMPHFEKLYTERGEEVQFLMVNVTDGMQETKEQAMAYLQNEKYTFPVCFDSELDATRAYAVHSFPTTYFIDANGNIMTYVIGMINEPTLRKNVRLLLENE